MKISKVRTRLMKVLQEWKKADLFRFDVLEMDKDNDCVILYTWSKEATADDWKQLYAAIMGLTWGWKGFSYVEVCPDHLEVVE